MKSATLLIALTLWLPDFANAQAPPVTTAQDWPKKVKLLQETRLDIQLGSVKANRKVPPNTEVDVLEVKLPNLVIRQNNATATIPADTTDFFERAGKIAPQKESENNALEDSNIPKTIQEENQSEFFGEPNPESLSNEEEKEFFAACMSADAPKIKAMLAANPKLANSAMVGRTFSGHANAILNANIGTFPSAINGLLALIDNAPKNAQRLEAIKALVEGGVDPAAITSEEKTSNSRGSVSHPERLTRAELEYLLSKGADPSFGDCGGSDMPPHELEDRAIPFIERKKSENNRRPMYAIPEMVFVKQGTLPHDSGLSGTKVASFHIGKYEVTWLDWQEVRAWAEKNGYSDLALIGDAWANDHPVRKVNWYDALKWTNARSEKEALQPVYSLNGSIYRSGEPAQGSNSIEVNNSANGYRLPTEAEWEWAARGGVNSQGYIYSGDNAITKVAWHNEFHREGKAVGMKKPNELGLHDMSGNLWEWCWEEGENDGRRLRGGAMHNWPFHCAVAFRRGECRPEGRLNYIGFRLARNANR